MRGVAKVQQDHGQEEVGNILLPHYAILCRGLLCYAEIYIQLYTKITTYSMIHHPVGGIGSFQ